MLLHVIEYNPSTKIAFAMDAANWKENTPSGHIINVYSNQSLKDGFTYSFIPKMFWMGNTFIRAELDYKEPTINHANH